MEYEPKSLKKANRDIREQYKDLPRRKRSFRIATVLFILFSVDMSLILNTVKNSGNEKVIDEYLETQDEDMLNDYYKNDAVRGNTDAMHKLEDEMLGISNNIALSGLSWNCESNVDFRNSIGDVEAYRRKKNGALVITVSGQTITEDEYFADEIIATNERVFFINTEDNYLWEYDIKNGTSSALYEGITKQFAVVGNQLYILNNGGAIIRLSLVDRSTHEVVTNVQRFYVAGSLIVQSGADIVTVSLDGSSHSTLASNVLVVGASDDNIYYVDLVKESDSPIGIGANGILEELKKLNKLYAMNINTKETGIVTCSDGFIRAVYCVDGDLVIDEVN